MIISPNLDFLLRLSTPLCLYVKKMNAHSIFLSSKMEKEQFVKDMLFSYALTLYRNNLLTKLRFGLRSCALIKRYKGDITVINPVTFIMEFLPVQKNDFS